MQLTHSFHVPVSVDEAWEVLRDVERIAPCMPGASIDSVDGDSFTGTVKVKVGPITVAYKGEASFVGVDNDNHRASIEAKGKETRGSGTARATVRAELKETAEGTQVTMITDLAVTGRPAQFGRGVMADVGGKLVGQFAECLSSELAAPEPIPATPPVGPSGTQQAPAAERTGPSAAAASTPRPAAQGPAERRTSDTIDLLDVAGAPIAKRLGPALAAAAALVLIIWLIARARGRS
ncbi:MAG: hypothetical protein GEU81_01025 [Nitriliruptorales bacterium]|nr:hypothetical protein [Nitriliruptorales bacterium]